MRFTGISRTFLIEFLRSNPLSRRVARPSLLLFGERLSCRSRFSRNRVGRTETTSVLVAALGPDFIGRDQRNRAHQHNAPRGMLRDRESKLKAVCENALGLIT